MLNPAAAAVGLSRYLDGGPVRMCKARLAFDTSGGKNFDISIGVATFKVCFHVFPRSTFSFDTRESC